MIMDNEEQFDSKKFKRFCIKLGFDLRFSLVAHPQTNSPAKLTNKIIFQGLKKNIDESNGKWVEKLPKTLWAYRIIHKNLTSETFPTSHWH